MRILLVDDHPLIRYGLRAMLADQEDLEVVGEAANGREAVEAVARLAPELVIMDIQMPDMDGLEATRRIKAIAPSTAVLVLTVNNSEMFLIEALRAGAGGYVLKDATSELLVPTIRALVQGASLIPADMLRKVLSSRPASPAAALAEPLSERELAVLQQLALGKSYQEISEQLALAYSTVKKHALNVVAKLEVSDRTQAVLKAVHLGLVEARLSG